MSECEGKVEDAHQSRWSGSRDPGEAGRDLSTAPAELGSTFIQSIAEHIAPSTPRNNNRHGRPSTTTAMGR